MQIGLCSRRGRRQCVRPTLMPREQAAPISVKPEQWATASVNSRNSKLAYPVDASPSDHIAAPSKTKPFEQELAWHSRKRRKATETLLPTGRRKQNDSVVRHISIAARLPMAQAYGDHARSAINLAMATSTTPNPSENCRTVQMWYIQHSIGLCRTSGSMPCASYPVNFISLSSQ